MTGINGMDGENCDLVIGLAPPNRTFKELH